MTEFTPTFVGECFIALGVFFLAFFYRASKSDRAIAKLNYIMLKKEGEIAAIHLKHSAMQERISTVNQRVSDVSKEFGEVRFKLMKGRVI